MASNGSGMQSEAIRVTCNGRSMHREWHAMAEDLDQVDRAWHDVERLRMVIEDEIDHLGEAACNRGEAHVREGGDNGRVAWEASHERLESRADKRRWR